jgi:predicted permease
MASFFESPTSFRLRSLASNLTAATLNFKSRRSIADASGQVPFVMANALANATTSTFIPTALGNSHNSHPDFLHLTGLVCEAVLEVVFVALPGFIAAVWGMFNTENQKFASELNTMVFTPCLIFTKLASQLNADKLADLGVIPIIFIAQTLVSFLSAHVMAWLWGFRGKAKRRQKNFIIAMAVFGNSNSLPISLVLSLSKTISGLHWDKIPGDNDDEVGARGILYLLIFQQLGQLVRWTWGFNVLLKPKSAYDDEDREEEEAQQEDRITEEGRYLDSPPNEEVDAPKKLGKPTDSGFGSGSQTPVSSISSSSSDDENTPFLIGATPANGNIISNEPRNISPTSSRSNAPNGSLYERARSTGHITTFPNFSQSSSHLAASRDESWVKRTYHTCVAYIQQFWTNLTTTISNFSTRTFNRLPPSIQKTLSFIGYYLAVFGRGVKRQMNPPLWAMLAALIVASVPYLQHLFFTHGTLINNSVTRAIQQSGGVAVPLILVVLGANLARGTLPKEQLAISPHEKKEERRLLIAALTSRMIIPTLIMAPVLALMAKYVPVSILDDPIFIIVCFLLTGAPSALQLAQICQINEVFMGAMSSLLVWSYVVAIFPSTLVLVMLALEVVEWAVI